MTYRVTRRLEFDAGHRVEGHEGKCRSPHGHRYTAEISCTAERLDVAGFVIDFGAIKERVGRWIDYNWDHTFIYHRGDALMDAMAQQIIAESDDLRPWYDLPHPPTAENMAQHLHSIASALLEKDGLRVVRVRIYETPNCWADYPGGLVA